MIGAPSGTGGPSGTGFACLPRQATSATARTSALHRKLEPLLRQAIVLAAIEAIQPRRAVAHALLDLVRLYEQIHREDLLPEISLVQLGAENDLVEALELREREPRG